MTDERSGTRQLGRGLSALFGDQGPADSETNSHREMTSVPIEFIRPNPNQPRQNFDPEQIDSLVESIKERGVLQPILVRQDTENPSRYEIVAGERRWRAAQKARLHEVPVVVKKLSDQDAFEISLIENIQRQDLNPLEEAEGYQRLVNEYAHTQEAIATAIGKSRSHVANMLRLLNLPDAVKKMLAAESLTMGHARALLNADNPEALARQIIKKGLNVRQTEKLVNQQKNATPKSAALSNEINPNTAALEKDLSDLLGLKVSINFHGNGGDLVIHYKTLDQLDDVLHRLKTDGQPLHRV